MVCKIVCVCVSQGFNLALRLWMQPCSVSGVMRPWREWIHYLDMGKLGDRHGHRLFPEKRACRIWNGLFCHSSLHVSSIYRNSVWQGTAVTLTREILLGYPTTQRGFPTAPDSYVPAWNTGALCRLVDASLWEMRFVGVQDKYAKRWTVHGMEQSNIVQHSNRFKPIESATFASDFGIFWPPFCTEVQQWLQMRWISTSSMYESEQAGQYVGLA